jgi:hypothetical protein
MSRWLLRIRDLTQSDEMGLTQEFLAQMLGVRRTSVSLHAGTLQKAGMIDTGEATSRSPTSRRCKAARANVTNGCTRTMSKCSADREPAVEWTVL